MVQTNELEIASNLASSLEQDGLVELAYYTAEFQPYSNAQKPDVIFRPRIGPWANQIVVFEIKIEPKPRATGGAYQNLVEHKQFCAEALDERIAQYFFMTNQTAPEFSTALLGQNGIRIFEIAAGLAPAISELRAILGLTLTRKP